MTEWVYAGAPSQTFSFSPDPAVASGIEVALNGEDIAGQGWHVDDGVMICGQARGVGRLVASERVARGCVAFAAILETSIGAKDKDPISVVVTDFLPAERLVFAMVAGNQGSPEEGGTSFIQRIFCGGSRATTPPLPALDVGTLGHRPWMVGSLFDHHGVRLRVIETIPAGPVVAELGTAISVVDSRHRSTSYRDVGGLATEVARIREMVELPLRRPDLFVRLGIEAPRGLLLYGPPGCGKTLIARAIAEQTDAFFLSINGPEVIQKHYGESEELLRKVFEEAQRHPAAILFIDEIDALAPNRETVLGDVEKRVVGQLLALMDGVSSRGKVVVMAATNLPNSVDPALRRPGRFDREIAINPPSRAGRLEILIIHTRLMPLSADVDLDRVAAVTHGLLGADLAALCREAGMACARESLADDARACLFVHMEHFQRALTDFRLSTMRELSTDIPDTRWEDIGGLEQPKRLLKEALDWPLIYGERFKHADAHPPRGILLTGASGTGKTLLAQAVGTTTEVNFIVARGPELLSKWVGESERSIREIFRRARQSAPSIIFFDEIDAIAPARGHSNGDGQIGDRMIGQLILELDACHDDSKVVVLAATNRPDLVYQALLRPGRFDLVIDLPAPDNASRLEILEVHCRKSPLEEDVDLAALAAATGGLHGADLATLCERAKMLAIAASIAAQPGQTFAPFRVGIQHFEAALRMIRQSRQAGEDRSVDHANQIA